MATSAQRQHGQEWIARQVGLLRQAVTEADDVERACDDVMRLADTVKKQAKDQRKEAKKKKDLLTIYMGRLQQAHVTGLSRDDVRAEVKREDFGVRLTVTSFSDVDKLQSQFKQMMVAAGKAGRGRRYKDPLAVSPHKVWVSTAVSGQDTWTPVIWDLMTTFDGRLVMADKNNKMVKVMSVSDPNTVTSVKIDEDPRCLARLSNGLVALTANNKTVFVLDVSGHVTVQSRIQTARQYRGVADGPDDVTLIAGCWKDDDGPASVHVVRRDNGHVVKVITDGHALTGLEMPWRMCVLDGHVLISGYDQDCVYRVEVTTGRLVDTLTHQYLKSPTQVVADEQGNVYVVSYDGQCVLVLTPSGQWRRLLHGSQHGDKDRVHPVCMCLTDTGVGVVWEKEILSARVVIGYDLV